MFRELINTLGQLFIWFVTVAPWEQAIRVRAGKYVRLLKPGMHLSVPGIDRVYRQSVRRRLTLVLPMTLTALDGHAVTVSAYVGYTITDLLRLYNTISHAEETIRAEVASLLAEFIGAHKLEECRAPVIESYVRSKLDLSKYGLGDEDFFLNNIAAVKTYRFITGELRSWLDGRSLDTDQAASAGTPSA